jgi:glucose-6-phosphate 1-dehydrogenase
VVNHLMQVVVAAAMEAPARGDPTTIKEAKVALFRSVVEANPAHYVRGQYDGYLDIDGVAADSTTETYAALRLEIENWRWSGVPFFIRAGKNLPAKQTEVNVVFHRPPRLGVGPKTFPEPNQMVIRIDPQPGARIRFLAKRASTEAFEPADLQVLFEKEPGIDPKPYERLLDDALRGDSQLFIREESVEQTWRVVEPLIDDPPKVEPYAPGSWGPDSAKNLVRGVCEWYEPWLPE